MHTLANHIRRSNNEIIKWRRPLQSDSVFEGGYTERYTPADFGALRGFQGAFGQTTTTTSSTPPIVEAGGWLDWTTNGSKISRGSLFGSPG